MFNKLQEYMQLPPEDVEFVLPSLQSVDRQKLALVVDQVNDLCQYLHSSDLRATAQLMFAAARLTTETLGIACSAKNSSGETSTHVAPWKRRLTSKLLSIRSDLARLLALQRNQLHRHDLIVALHRKYLSNGAWLHVAIEILRQKVLAYSRK